MELRTLRYFVALVDEGTVTGAAKALHVTQPTLSRQLAQLEREMGRPLFERGHAGIELTEAGVTLNRHARRILELAEKAEEEVAAPTSAVSGVVHIGAGETKAIALLARAMERTRKRYPSVTFDVHDGTADALMDDFLHGYFDVLLECDTQPHSDLNVLELPVGDVWGVYVKEDSPLARLDVVTADDLVGTPVILSSQGNHRTFGAWAGERLSQMDVAATYSLPLNARFLAEEGMGALVSYGGLVDDRDRSSLVFRELSPRLEAKHGVLWRKVRPTRQTQAFLDELKAVVQGTDRL
ncbi:MAG: LysR family transcriptional regulator [Tractidigestivibacter sp.]|jgi:DNA-binding transcriptional LysR family regulator|uniref:LysR family transcriptional regulator n=1 Tax=Tractidigestivibacter sp. TaxID=2847320 RepID=UPI003D900560